MQGTTIKSSSNQAGTNPGATPTPTSTSTPSRRSRAPFNPLPALPSAPRSPSRPSRGRLASARDRQRLRERQFAERSRVEEMLASAPLVLPEPASRPGHFSTRPGLRSVPEAGCPVCASAKIVRDEVMSAGLLRLSECLHCDHRWTERPRARWNEIGAGMNRGRPQLASV